MAAIQQRRLEDTSSRKQRIAALDLEVDDEKEMEEIKEDIASNPPLSSQSNPVAVPAATLHISNGPLLPPTQAPMAVLTPTPSATIEDSRKKPTTSSINLAEFESYSTNPFEEMELKTLNDKEELAMLLQPPPPTTTYTGLPAFQTYSSQGAPWTRAPANSYIPVEQYPTTSSWIPNENLVFNQSLEARLGKVSVGPAVNSVPSTSFVMSSSTLQGGLRQAKSFPDLSEMSATGANAAVNNYPSTSCATPDKRLSSRTPPPRLTSENIGRPKPKPILSTMSQWEKRLNASEKCLVQQLHDMGFPRDRSARAILRLGSNQKDVVDQLLIIRKFEDLGHQVENIELALEVVKPGKDFCKDLEAHLTLFNQLLALGFAPEKIGPALVAAGLDRDKALDILLAM